MQKLFTFNPVLCAALAAAFSYYGFAPLIQSSRNIFLVLIFFLIVFILIAAAVLLKAPLIASCAATVPRLNFFNGALSQPRDLSKKALLFLVFFTAGMFLGLFARGAASRAGRIAGGFPRENICGITGLLLDDPRTNATGRGMGNLSLIQSALIDGSRASAKGTVLVFFPEGSIPRLKEFGRGSTIYVDGSFAEPQNSAFNGASAGGMFRAKSVHIVQPPSKIDRLRTRARLGLINIFAGETNWGGLALALLLGARDNLDSNLAAQYRNAGCSYILALSGMHLAIVSAIIAFLLKKPFGLKAAAALGAIIIVFYVYLVGAQPSLTRAALMSLIGTVCILFSFPARAVQLLALSFLAQIIIDSRSALSVSFILSYLALLGILLVGRSIANVTAGKLPAFLAAPLSASLGAFLATIAITAFFFGELRPAGIAAGLLMVPLTTLFMIGAIGYLALSFVFPLFNTPLGFALSLLYKLLERIAFLAGKIPSISVTNMPLALILGSLLPFLIFFLCQHRFRVQHTIESFE
ncbi:MAG: ComEC/Rec2 family competence protein [Spirochaetaceae bacterium]|jgi:competence protein ComEC|nr:ComEC/Rec2 family competence protein [Spirochaetaceae bacterium]